MGEIRVGCSGWMYDSWRGVLYPAGVPKRRWLATYAETFDTVEVNSTFYRLASPTAVEGWLADTPPDFTFTLKASRYLTHMRRLTDLGQGVDRFCAAVAPIAAGPKLGPVLWQLPPNFRRDDERLAAALRALPAGRHAFEFRHATWFVPEVMALLREHGVALCIGDDPSRPFQPLAELTADFTLVRLHRGVRGRRGNYSATEIAEWAGRLRALAARADVFAYFNNDWEGFAVRNAIALRNRL